MDGLTSGIKRGHPGVCCSMKMHLRSRAGWENGGMSVGLTGRNKCIWSSHDVGRAQGDDGFCYIDSIKAYRLIIRDMFSFVCVITLEILPGSR